MRKTLVMCRHGHRDTSDRDLDNGLSEKGRDQARAIKEFFGERFHTEDSEQGGLWFLSSPKKRCIETLQPASKEVGRTVDVHPDLDEQKINESGTLFERRVQRFLKEWSESKAELTVVASHGDWLPVATFHLLGFAYDFKKGGWLEIEFEAGRAYLKWCIPSFKPFYA